jgi:hypothetical protein
MKQSLKSQVSSLKSRACLLTLDMGHGTWGLRLGALTLGLFVALASACSVGARRSGLPPAAQNAIDTITDDIAAGRADKVYAEAADEWRQATTPDQSRAQLERVQNTFGRVLSRALVEGREQQSSSGALAGHTLVATFNTRFERADAIETFTLVEREGHWLLARYVVNSEALKQ